MASEPAFLTSLPVELMVNVAEAISPSDLLSLRSACRDTAAKTHDIFLRTHFRDKCFMISNKASMSTLLQISKNEILARSIRRLCFFSTRLIHVTRLEHRQNAIKELCALDSVSPVRRSQADKRRPPYEAFEAGQQAFVRRDCMDVLTEIFLNFAEIGSTPASTLSNLSARLQEEDLMNLTNLDQFLADVRPWGYQVLCKIFKTPRYSTAYHRDHADHINVYKALLSARYPVQALTLGDVDMPFNVHMLAIRDSSFLSNSLRLLKLKVLFPRGLGAHPTGGYARAGLSASVHFLAGAHSLESLVLGVSYTPFTDPAMKGPIFKYISTMAYPDGTRIVITADAQMLPKLKTLELQDHDDLDLHTLLSFLRERRRTLTALTLDSV
ncbi:uncharacterized protein LTR77_007982 [Saxophila tyrrhenica]|uniref:F-box domain-containing protein n=1 Tax=Saxophila tyrrhenica TaxID=1690608 RepID=A0AAV9P5E0_9PEZI|nr:hypothetical protein LTR77_007982 [Saxophila tyrrhenica]